MNDMTSTSTPDIVLIEDNEDEVLTTLRALRRSAFVHEVRVIGDGLQALEYVTSLRDSIGAGAAAPSAIFLDLRLPGADGKRVLREIREHESTRDIPVVVVSSTRRDAEIEECYRLGANSFISKQYGGAHAGEYLVQAMRYWIELNRLPS
jgi:CheY-like chemotaxis protein